MRRENLFSILFGLLFMMPNFVFGQIPNLGEATSFALFTAAGAFNNLGNTSIVGDIGTDVGAFSGFPPGILVGEIHVADATSAQAATDVDVAYSYLSSLTCGMVIGTTLGNNQVLTPNIYCLGAASSLNGDLILDGEGDPNAIFIFKINGALSTSTFSNVVLLNSASLCNVYWQVNGAFALGDGSVFRGTLLVNGAISLLE
ncbi:MAG: ice-binding family protein, partial [Saprospiraceae bacterium]